MTAPIFFGAIAAARRQPPTPYTGPSGGWPYWWVATLFILGLVGVVTWAAS